MSSIYPYTHTLSDTGLTNSRGTIHGIDDSFEKGLWFETINCLLVLDLDPTHWTVTDFHNSLREAGFVAEDCRESAELAMIGLNFRV